MTTVNLTKRTKLLIGIAAAISAYVMFAQKDPQTIEPVKSGAAVRTSHAVAVVPAPPPATRSLLQLAHRVVDQAAAGALFAAHSWYVAPPPPPPAPAVADAAPAPPPQPTAPPLPFTYIGSYTPDGAIPVFFLTQGDRVYDVRAGDELDNVYHVEGLYNGTLVFTYKPLNVQQSITIPGSTP